MAQRYGIAKRLWWLIPQFLRQEPIGQAWGVRLQSSAVGERKFFAIGEISNRFDLKDIFIVATKRYSMTGLFPHWITRNGSSQVKCASRRSSSHPSQLLYSKANWTNLLSVSRTLPIGRRAGRMIWLAHPRLKRLRRKGQSVSMPSPAAWKGQGSHSLSRRATHRRRGCRTLGDDPLYKRCMPPVALWR